MPTNRGQGPSNQTDGSGTPTHGGRLALVAGSTGLIGSFLVEALLDDPLYGKVRALARRPLRREHAKLKPWVVDFDRLAELEVAEAAERFSEIDVFCCLGTTIKKAGSREAFRRVDHDYVAALAKLGRAAGARRFLLVSSIGADATSGNFYLGVKGAAEESVAALDYPIYHAFRPSLLTGPRRERRSGERLGIAASHLLTPLLLGGLRRYRPIAAQKVAAAMVAVAEGDDVGRWVHLYDSIVRLAGE